MNLTDGSESRAWLYVVIVAVASGLLSWGIEEVHMKVADPAQNFQREKGMSFVDATKALRSVGLASTTRTAMFSYGAMGALLGLGLGLIGGRSQGSWKRGALAGLAGLVVGATAGALFAAYLVPRYFNTLTTNREAVEDDLSFPFLTHLGLWVGVGLGGGVGLGLALGSWKRMGLAVLGGLLGVVLGTAIYEFGGAVAFPLAETNLPVSREVGSRILAHLAVALAAACGAYGVATSMKPKLVPSTLAAASADGS